MLTRRAALCQTPRPTNSGHPALPRTEPTRRSAANPPERTQPQSFLPKKLFTLLDLCVSSLRRGHANLLCIVPILTDDPRRGSNCTPARAGPMTHIGLADNPWGGRGGVASARWRSVDCSCAQQVAAAASPALPWVCRSAHSLRSSTPLPRRSYSHRITSIVTSDATSEKKQTTQYTAMKRQLSCRH